MAEKILFADDSPVIKKIVKKTVEGMNYELLSANDGKEALTLLAQEAASVKLILSDWNMPVMNGFELLTAVKGNPAFKHIPVIMITTEAEKANINKAIQAGAANYILKPFNTDELVSKITKCLA
ncbi:MAG: response regulator [Solirubrobacterales bacterium]